MTDKTLPPLPEHWMTAELRDMPAAYQRAAREYAEDYARAAFAAQKPEADPAAFISPAELAALPKSGSALVFRARTPSDADTDPMVPLFAAAPPAENPVEAGHRRATPEESAAVDDALGLVLLPPIRITQRAHALLSRIAEARGMVLQAVVREALEPGETTGAAQPQKAPQPLTEDARDAARYRWLRGSRALDICEQVYGQDTPCDIPADWGREMDEWVDADMSSGTKPEGGAL